jgi:PST family polysaccharide transporter
MGSAATLVAQFLRIIIIFLSQLILARFLFPVDFGLLAMIAPVIALIQVINDLGFGQVLIQRPKIYQSQTSTLFWINLFFSVVLAIILSASAPLLAWIYDEPRILPLMIVMAGLVPIGTLGIYPNALLIRQLKVVPLAVLDVVVVLLGSACTVFLSWLWSSYWALVVGQFVTTISQAFATWLICGWYPSRPSKIKSVREDLVFGRNITATNIADFASTSGGNILIGAVAGPVALGLYDRSYRLVVQPLKLVLVPLGRVAIPLLSQLRNSPERYLKAYLLMIQLILLSTLPLMVVCIIDGHILIKILLGERWEAAGTIFSWLSVGGLAAGLYTSFPWLFVSQDKTGSMFRYMLAASVVNVLSFGIGILWGAVGVAAVSGVSYLCIQTPLVMYGATRRGPVNFVMIVRCILPICSAAVVAVSVIWLRPTLGGSWADVLVDLTISYGGTAGLMLAMPRGRLLAKDCVGIMLTRRTN